METTDLESKSLASRIQKLENTLDVQPLSCTRPSVIFPTMVCRSTVTDLFLVGFSSLHPNQGFQSLITGEQGMVPPAVSGPKLFTDHDPQTRTCPAL